MEIEEDNATFTEDSNAGKTTVYEDYSTIEAVSGGGEQKEFFHGIKS